MLLLLLLLPLLSPFSAQELKTKKRYGRLQKSMGDYCLLAGSPLDAQVGGGPGRDAAGAGRAGQGRAEGRVGGMGWEGVLCRHCFAKKDSDRVGGGGHRHLPACSAPATKILLPSVPRQP